jgi:hypothetical protein
MEIVVSIINADRLSLLIRYLKEKHDIIFYQIYFISQKKKCKFVLFHEHRILADTSKHT